MNSEHDLERAVRTWVARGSEQLPDAYLDAALDAIASTAQRRATWWPVWRLGTMNTALKFGLIASVVAVATVLGLAYLGAPGVGDRAPADASPTSVPSPQGHGLLVFEVQGDIYLAEADGSNPNRVADGMNQTLVSGGPPEDDGVDADGVVYSLSPGSTWSPDGLHFVYSSSDGEFHISDAEGRVVTSFAPTPAFGYWDKQAWSPDSTRLQGWTSDGTQIAIYGIDGLLQASISPPEGYRRLYDIGAFWAPDGRSLIAPIQQGRNEGEVWELPIDGSAPRQLAEDDPLANAWATLSFDGSRVAFTPDSPDSALYVANADGTDTRGVAAGQNGVAMPKWSPSGTHLAFYAGRNVIDLRVLDVASGIVLTAVPEASRDGYPPYGWSPAGDRLLFMLPGGDGETSAPSLWTVNLDGTDRTLLVEGALWGEWQPTATTAAP